MAKWCDEGELDVLEKYLKTQTLYIGLYKGPTSEPAEGAKLTDITEPSGNNYARIALASDDWTISGSAPTEAIQPQKIFTASGGDWGEIYGYFITDVSSGTLGKLIAVEQFSDGPYDVKNNGSIKITLKLTCN